VRAIRIPSPWSPRESESAEPASTRRSRRSDRTAYWHTRNERFRLCATAARNASLAAGVQAPATSATTRQVTYAGRSPACRGRG
jgi:hypothetical protein